MLLFSRIATANHVCKGSISSHRGVRIQTPAELSVELYLAVIMDIQAKLDPWKLSIGNCCADKQANSKEQNVMFFHIYPLL